MIQLLVEIPKATVPWFEDRLMEMEIPSWTIREDRIRKLLDLIGYFESEEAGLASYKLIRDKFPELQEKPVISPVQDRDWKESYKDHFNPWNIGNLHWVPTWLRDHYALPVDARVVYLDPGMAFGTGNHETTRLCAVRLVEIAKEWGNGISERKVIDAGCGSGILAISAFKLGFGSVSGFDIDPASVQIADENAVVNGMKGSILFTKDGLDTGLSGKQADIVLANILANVLVEYSDILLKSVLPGGRLVLSGILASEVDDVKAVFEPKARIQWGACELRSRIDGEWADILLSRQL